MCTFLLLRTKFADPSHADHTILRRQHNVVARGYDSSSYGSSDSSYGNSGSNYDSSTQYYDNRAYGGGQYDAEPNRGAEANSYGDSSSAAAAYETPAAMAHEASSSAMAHEMTSMEMAHETSKVKHVASSTSSALEVKQTQYGSGYMAPSYDSCVQTCQATYGRESLSSLVESS